MRACLPTTKHGTADASTPTPGPLGTKALCAEIESDIDLRTRLYFEEFKNRAHDEMQALSKEMKEAKGQQLAHEYVRFAFGITVLAILVFKNTLPEWQEAHIPRPYWGTWFR